MRNEFKVCTGKLIVILVSTFLAVSCQFNGVRPTPFISHSIQNLSRLAEIWSLKNVYVGQYPTSRMVASAGKVFILGNTTNATQDIICYDGQTGNEVWQKTNLGQGLSGFYDGYPTLLIATPDGLFAGFGGVPSVKKYNISTGDLIWSRSLSGRGMPYLFFYGDEVQVTTNPFNFTIINAESGQVVLVMKGEDIFILTPDKTFLHLGMNILLARNTITGERLWDVNLDSNFSLAPIFTTNAIYVRTGDFLGRVYAIQGSSGTILWKTDNDVISNIAISMQKQSIYALANNGEIWQINIDNGQHTVIGQFSNLPFTLSGRDFLGAYDIAYDDSTDTLYIVLGDSLQLFALKAQ